jgi:hypothetical protein
MVLPSLGLHSSKASVLERSFLTSSDYGMIASRRRLFERLLEAHRRMVMWRTLHFPVRQRGARGRSE